MICRKYRGLDDCSRLRDIIDALPARRHFVPSLLTISWTDPERNDTIPDLYNMISKLIKDNVLGGHQDFPIASETKALDEKLGEALVSLPLDVEGRLVQSLSVRGAWTGFDQDMLDAEQAVMKAFSSILNLHGEIYQLNGWMPVQPVQIVRQYAQSVDHN